MAKDKESISPKRHELLTRVSLGIILTMLLVMTCLMYLINKRPADYVISKAINKTFSELSSDRVLLTSGEVFVETEKEGSIIGLTFSGYISANGVFSISVDTGYLVPGSSVGLMRKSIEDPVILNISRIHNITGVYVVGDAKMDLGLQKVLRNHLNDLYRKWFELDNDETIKDILRVNKLEFLQLLFKISDLSESLSKAYTKAPFLSVEKGFSGEVFYKTPTTKYTLKVDDEKLGSFLNLANNYYKSEYTSKDNFSSQLKYLLENVNQLDVWVNNDTKRIDKIYLGIGEEDKRYTVKMLFGGESPRPALEYPSSTRPGSELVQIIKDE